MTNKTKTETKTKTKEDNNVSFYEQTQKFLNDKNNKDYHYNNIIDDESRIPSGSLLLDIAMDGGLPVGIHRHGGPYESGKTSQALSFAKNFQKASDKNIVVYVKAEGRLKKSMLKRAGIDISKDKFFILDSNVTEVVFDFIKDLIENNPNNNKYFIIIDSSDALVRKEDLKRPFSDSEKVAGGALTNSVFLKKFSLPTNKLGHRIILISQVRITIDMGHGGKPPKESQAGGKSIDHYSNFSLDFRRYFGENFTIYDKKKDKKTNPFDNDRKMLGHKCVVKFRKSDNQKTGAIVQYPIRYDSEDGESIWLEREILETCLDWACLEKKGSWFSIEKSLKEELEKENVPTFDKIQGEESVVKWLEQKENKKFVDHFYKYFRKIFSSVE